MGRIFSSISPRFRVTDTRPWKRARRSNSRSPRDPRGSRQPTSPRSSLPVLASSVSSPALPPGRIACDTPGPDAGASPAPGRRDDPCYDFRSMAGRSSRAPHRLLPLGFMLGVELLTAARCSAPSPASTIERAQRLRAEGHAPEAAALLADLVRREPGDFAAHYELARTWHAAGKQEDALAEIGSAIEINPASPDARLVRSEVLSALNRDDEAIVELRRVVSADPSRSGVHRRMGIIHARGGRPEQA